MSICKKCDKVIYDKSIQCPNCLRLFHMNVDCLDARRVSLSGRKEDKPYNIYDPTMKCKKCGDLPSNHRWRDNNEWKLRFCPSCGQFLYAVCAYDGDCSKSYYSEHERKWIYY